MPNAASHPPLAGAIHLDPDFTVGEVNPRLFGSFVEHLGRCVYTGIYEPGHPTADEDGLRTDVLDLVRELGVTTVRYPGGNFVSGYRWEDGVGPRRGAAPPARPRLAHHRDQRVRPRRVHRASCGKAGVEPMMAVNLGTRGVAEALDLLEYANHPGGTALSDLRVAPRRQGPVRHPAVVPGQRDGRPLADRPQDRRRSTAGSPPRPPAPCARSTPACELVACGSSSQRMPTFGAWEATVLEETYDLVDYISLHAYYEESDGDLDSLPRLRRRHGVASSTTSSPPPTTSAPSCKSTKKINLSFDEWNVWYQEPAGPRTPTREDWAVAPRLLEDDYTVTDAVVFGSLLITLLRHADRVTAACLAQLVNVIAPIMTEPGGPAWRQTTFYPFAQASRVRARARCCGVGVDIPTYETPKYGEVPLLHATAVRGRGRRRSPSSPSTGTPRGRSNSPPTCGRSARWPGR